jgi:23S rRNA-/tRNA-specific pseudouridylate synthase
VAGLSLASWLAERFRYADESAWRSHCEAGRLSVNTRPAGPDSPLHAGDEVQFSPPADLEPPVDESYSIVFERDGLLVIDKPADYRSIPPVDSSTPPCGASCSSDTRSSMS